MPKSAKKLASPESLPARSKKGDVTVVIETPKGSRNKYKFEETLGAYALSGVLPEGMVFPYDFGFIPQTRADDGDPVDVLLLMDAPAFPGCVVQGRLIGVIEGEQEEKGGKVVRNDRLIAVARKSRQHSELTDIAQLNPAFVNDIGQFFTNYRRLRGASFRVLAVKGPNKAVQLLEKAHRQKKAA